MPEGPSILIAKENLIQFKGKKIIEARGNAKIDMESLVNKKVLDIRAWGKQFFFCMDGFSIRIHFLMFGSYNIGEHIKQDRSLRLALTFPKNTVYFYTCSVKIIEDDLDSLYDWKADVLSDKWDPAGARKKLKALPPTMVCDALLDQQIFSGVGNIIKNEVLYRIRVHPETLVHKIPARKLTELIKEARNYSFDFLKWKKAFILKKHWLAHTKKTCHRCDIPLIKKYCGKTKRRSFFCTNCQIKY
jgi:endonuclease VIII